MTYLEKINELLNRKKGDKSVVTLTPAIHKFNPENTSVPEVIAHVTDEDGENSKIIALKFLDSYDYEQAEYYEINKDNIIFLFKKA